MFKYLHPASNRYSINVPRTGQHKPDNTDSFQRDISSEICKGKSFQRALSNELSHQSQKQHCQSSKSAFCFRRTTLQACVSHKTSQRKEKQSPKPSEGMQKFVQTTSCIPNEISDWSNEDVCEWFRQKHLDKNGLLVKQLRNTQVSGQHLCDPECAWRFLSKMKFVNDQHKQDVLLSFAACLSTSNKKVPNGKHKKHQSSVGTHTTLHSAPGETSDKGKDSLQFSSDYASFSSTSSSGGANSALSSERKNKENKSFLSSPLSSSKRVLQSFSIMKQTAFNSKETSPSFESKLNNMLHSIKIYSNVQTSNKFSPTDLQITYDTTTVELIQIYLDCCSITDDINLFVLNDVSCSSADINGQTTMTTKRLLEPYTNPLAVYKNIVTCRRPDYTRRLELTQVKGVIVKIQCRIGTHKLRGKQIRISTQSSVDHVVRVALRKFRLRNVDAELFTLCESTMNGAVKEIDRNRKPLWNSATTMILCDRQKLNKFNGTDNQPSTSLRYDISETSLKSISPSKTVWQSYSGEYKRLTSCDTLLEETMSSDEKAFDNDVTIFNQSTLPSFRPCSVVYDESQNVESIHGMKKSKIKALSIDNSMLQAQVQEKEEQIQELQRKVSQMRQILETGLQQYASDSCQHHIDKNGSALAIETEMKNTEKQITEKEEMLWQLFRHQRQIEVNQKRQVIEEKHFSHSIENAPVVTGKEALDLVTLADVDLQIALHQADLLNLMHRYEILDMKMSLFVSNRKAEKFRHMINGSLYDVITSKRNEPENEPKTVNETKRCDSIFACELFSENSGYTVALKDQCHKQDSGVRTKGTVVEQDCIEGNLKSGDRLLEVNGINVLTVDSNFVTRILQDTTSARIVVLRNDTRKSKRGYKSPPDEIIPTTEKSIKAISSPQENFTCDNVSFCTNEVADVTEMSALKCDLSMLMRELETTSRAKRELERAATRTSNHRVTLESENRRLKEKISELRSEQNSLVSL
ncbi:unnamed protein product [Clavelina lepadiformis]|uniref:PDZ domain-containing protein n=1 Tax=Clavelina lepadiformis TaxID=159417 RepID=A0ABP0GTQ2_CLALP